MKTTLENFTENLEVSEMITDLILIIDEQKNKKDKIDSIDYAIKMLTELRNEIN